MDKDTNTLREEWNKECFCLEETLEKPATFKCKYDKEEIYKFFNNKFNQKLEEIEEEIEIKKIEWEWITEKVEWSDKPQIYCSICSENTTNPECPHLCEFENKILDLALQIIKNKKN